MLTRFALLVALALRFYPAAADSSPFSFDRTISRQVLENYLARSITMEGLLNGRGLNAWVIRANR